MKLKKRLFIVKSLTLAVVLMLIVVLAAPMAQAATPQEIEDAIEDGLAWLANQQNPDGSWHTSNRVGRTGLAVLKFETHAIFMGMSPFDPLYEYSDNVIAGLDYIFANAVNVPIALQPAGDPDTNGNGIGVKAHDPSANWYEMYETGIALMAICASDAPSRTVSGGPQNGRAYSDVAQDMVDFIAWAQCDAGNHGPSRGGWRYTANNWDSDNSISGYVTIGLAYAEAPSPWGFGLTIPPFVFSELNLFINALQDPVNGDTDDGGSWYVPASWAWVNILKTGNLLSEMGISGDSISSTRVQDAIDYIERHWLDASWDPGWYGVGNPDYQTCFTMMKGFQGLGIETIDTGGGPFSWYDVVADRIVTTQNPDGSWPGDNWGDPVLTTAWAMLTLEKAAPPALSLLPPFDINPTGTSHTVTAVYKIAGVPQADVEIEFEVISGPNAGEMGSDTTDASGEAEFTYTGAGGAGTDIIKATAVDPAGAPLVSSQATKVWEAPSVVEVGGEVYAVNKLAILAPWLALVVVIMAGATLAVRRRRVQS